MPHIPMRSSAESAAPIRAEINVTPLVDVCLVLLIIFMVVTPLLDDTVPVSLPRTPRPAALPKRDDQIAVAVSDGGAIFVGHARVDVGELTALLRVARGRVAGRQVVLKADRHLAYRRVREVMKAINAAGFSGVGLVAVREPDQTGAAR